jgi:hypothetical protein
MTESETEQAITRLRAPALVAWLVANTEKLVLVATTLDERAGDLSPSISRERVIELCQAIRHTSLELTVALFSLLSRPEDEAENVVLADAIANAHVRIQDLELSPGEPSSRDRGA